MNRFFNWHSNLDTGIKDIDVQHRQLVDYIDELYQAVMSSDIDAASKVKQVVGKMYVYAATHLTDEEELLKRINYPTPDFDKHIAEHDKFRAKMRDFEYSVQNGYPVTFQVVQFLKDWLTDHIKQTDMGYAEFMKQNKLM